MVNENRARPIQIIFRVNEHEREVIRKRMKLAKTNKLSAFCRKMVMDGMIINVEYSQIKELLIDVGRASSNINQIAKRVNSSNRIYSEDIEELKAKLDLIHNSIIAIDNKLIWLKGDKFNGCNTNSPDRNNAKKSILVILLWHAIGAFLLYIS